MDGILPPFGNSEIFTKFWRYKSRASVSGRQNGGQLPKFVVCNSNNNRMKEFQGAEPRRGCSHFAKVFSKVSPMVEGKPGPKRCERPWEKNIHNEVKF